MTKEKKKRESRELTQNVDLREWLRKNGREMRRNYDREQRKNRQAK